VAEKNDKKRGLEDLTPEEILDELLGKHFASVGGVRTFLTTSMQTKADAEFELYKTELMRRLARSRKGGVSTQT